MGTTGSITAWPGGNALFDHDGSKGVSFLVTPSNLYRFCIPSLNHYPDAKTC